MTYDYTPFGDQSTLAGDPIEVSALSRKYAATVHEIDKAADGLVRIKNGNADWKGLAGPHFQEKCGDLSSRISATRKRYEAASTSLQTYSNELDTAQWDASRAAEQGRTAQATATANEPAPPAPAGTPPPTAAEQTAANTRSTNYSAAQSDLSTAQRQFINAVDDYHSAAQKASNAIRDAINHDGLKDSWWYRHWEGIKQVLEIVALVIAVVVVVCLVLACPWTLALLGLAADSVLAGTAGTVLTGAMIAGVATSGAILGMDIYGKSQGMDVSNSQIAWDVVGLGLSVVGAGVGKVVETVSAGSVEAAASGAGRSAWRQVMVFGSDVDGFDDLLSRADNASKIAYSFVK